MLTVVAVLVGLVAGALAAVVALWAVSGSRLRRAEESRARLIGDAEREAETLRRESQIEAREQSVKLRGEIEAEIRDRRAQVVKLEERVLQREEEVETKLTELARREQGISDRETHLKSLQEELKGAKEQALGELQRISGLTVSEAKQHLLERSEDLVRHELARTVRQLDEEARSEAKRRA